MILIHLKLNSVLAKFTIKINKKLIQVFKKKEKKEESCLFYLLLKKSPNAICLMTCALWNLQTIFILIRFLFCSECCHSCCDTDNCNNRPCMDIVPISTSTPAISVPAIINPRAIQCLQGQRLLVGGIEVLNNLQMSHCPGDTDICHRYDVTARQDGQTGK